jgi:hypothetical protein
MEFFSCTAPVLAEYLEIPQIYLRRGPAAPKRINPFPPPVACSVLFCRRKISVYPASLSSRKSINRKNNLKKQDEQPDHE